MFNIQQSTALTHARHHYHSHSCSSASLLSLLFPYISPQPPGSFFLFYFPLSFTDLFFSLSFTDLFFSLSLTSAPARTFVTHRSRRPLATRRLFDTRCPFATRCPSSCAALALALSRHPRRIAPRMHHLRRTVPSSRAAYVALCLRHAPPLSHHTFVMRCLGCGFVLGLHSTLGTNGTCQ